MSYGDLDKPGNRSRGANAASSRNYGGWGDSSSNPYTTTSSSTSTYNGANYGPSSSSGAYQLSNASSIGTSNPASEFVTQQTQKILSAAKRLESERSADGIRQQMDDVKDCAKAARAKIDASRGIHSVTDRAKRELEAALDKATAAGQRASERIKRESAAMKAHQQELIHNQQAQSSTSPNPFSTVPLAHSNNDDHRYYGQRQNQEQMALTEELMVNERLIDERDKELADIEAAIYDVNSIVKDLAEKVHEQGDQMDLIEHQVARAENITAKGTQELSKASELQKKARKKMCCLLFLVVIIGAAIAVVVFGVMGKL